jgi:hypothetical protein
MEGATTERLILPIRRPDEDAAEEAAEASEPSVACRAEQYSHQRSVSRCPKRVEQMISEGDGR